MFRNKKGQVGAGTNKILNLIIGIIILSTVVTGTVGLLLDNLTNLSTSGIFLGVLFSTVVPIVFAVIVYKAMTSGLKL